MKRKTSDISPLILEFNQLVLMKVRGDLHSDVPEVRNDGQSAVIHDWTSIALGMHQAKHERQAKHPRRSVGRSR